MEPSKKESVMPAKAGMQESRPHCRAFLDSGFRRNDDIEIAVGAF
jgi:hypothetical protein